MAIHTFEGNKKFCMQVETKKLLLVYVGIFFSMVFWSLSFIWYKDAYQFFGPMATVFLRLLFSGIILIIIAWLAGKLKIEKKHIKLFLIAAFFEPFLYFMGESFGMKLISSVTASVIIATIPVLTPTITSFFYEEKLTALNITGIIISFLGVAMVILKKDLHLEASPLGVALMFIAVFAAIGYAMALKKLTPYYEPLTIVALQNIIGAFLFAPLFFIVDWHTFSLGFPLKALIPIINLSIFASSIAFILYAYAVQAIGVNKANMFTNLIPVLTSVFAYLLLNERFTYVKVFGIFVVVGGLFLSQLNVTVYKRLLGWLVWWGNDKK
jgi:drug/metabolite transporter (DMT)-like permease